MSHPLLALARRLHSDGHLGRAAVDELRIAARGLADAHGRATSGVARVLLAIEGELGGSFTKAAAARFQTTVAELGARLRGPIALPEDDTPFWLLGAHPLGDFRSTAIPPRRADVVIIGAGLTGASTAYHLAAHVRRGLRVVVIDAGDPATGASGRNGGNFELIPENFLGVYAGLPAERLKYLRRCYPRVDEATLYAQAQRQAAAIMRFGARNTEALLRMAGHGGVGADCDVSAAGWLRIAESAAEEAGLRDEIAFARRLHIPFALWPPARIRRTLGIPARFAGRLCRRNGNYHPFKLVTALLTKAIAAGVGLYTRTPVLAVRAGAGERVVVETAAGPVEAGRIVFATNAFTPQLLPELGAIRYHQSQIFDLEHVRDGLRGMTVTEKKGDLYYNFPGSRRYVDGAGQRRGMLHVGGGLDRPGRDPSRLRRSAAILAEVKADTDERFPETRGQPPSRLWTGPMAFTPDRVPAIGFLRRPSGPARAFIVAAGFNGYGGSYCLETGRLAARMVREGKTPAEIPEDIFSPNRFLTSEPLFARS
jgi:glycine/D-amino acid oxidase-like deaminating enzyme